MCIYMFILHNYFYKSEIYNNILNYMVSKKTYYDNNYCYFNIEKFFEDHN